MCVTPLLPRAPYTSSDKWICCMHACFVPNFEMAALAFVVVVVVAVGVAVAAVAAVVVGKRKNAAEKGSNHKEEPATTGDLLSSPE